MADKTEAPTSHRLQEAREEGQVVRSQELITAVVILTGAFLLRGPGQKLGTNFESLLTTTIVDLPNTTVTTEWLRGTIFNILAQILPQFSYIVLGMMLAHFKFNFSPQVIISPKKCCFNYCG